MSISDLGRQACRLAGEYILAHIEILTRSVDQNFVSAAIFSAILRANVDGITVTRDIALRHLGLADLPADELRLPVSIYALARTLNLPYETVRRHVHKLQSAGLVLQLAGGVIVPTRILMLPEAREGALANQRAVQTFVDQAARFGLLGQPAEVGAVGDAPLQIARLSTDFFLDVIRTLSDAMKLDLVSSLALHALGQLNTAKIRRDVELGAAFGSLQATPPDDLRTPISVYRLARFLRLPYETTRRICLWLAELDLVERTDGGGLIVPARVFARPEMIDAFTACATSTQTFLDDVAAYGMTPRASAAHPPPRHTLAEGLAAVG